MTFSEALQLVKDGYTLRRECWAETLFLEYGTQDKFGELELYITNGNGIKSGEVSRWSASQVDILSDDWQLGGKNGNTYSSATHGFSSNAKKRKRRKRRK